MKEDLEALTQDEKGLPDDRCAILGMDEGEDGWKRVLKTGHRFKEVLS